MWEIVGYIVVCIVACAATLVMLTWATNGGLVAFIERVAEFIRELCGERRRQLRAAAKGQAQFDVDATTKGSATGYHTFHQLDMATITPKELDYLITTYEEEVQRITGLRVQAETNQRHLDDVTEKHRKALRAHRKALAEARGEEESPHPNPDPYGNQAREEALRRNERIQGKLDEADDWTRADFHQDDVVVLEQGVSYQPLRVDHVARWDDIGPRTQDALIRHHPDLVRRLRMDRLGD